MVPVCWWQDVTESIGMLLPISLEVPDELNCLDWHCLNDSACAGADGADVESAGCLALRCFPPTACLKSCREAPFSYESVQNVLAATEFAADNVLHFPLLDHQTFTKELSKHERIMLRSSTDSVHAHRVCALLGSYMQLNWQPSVVRDCWN